MSVPSSSALPGARTHAVGEVPYSDLNFPSIASLRAAAALIAVGDSTLRYLALSKVRDADGRSLVDLIDNRVVGIVGNYIACPLRSFDALPSELRTAFRAAPISHTLEETVVTVPIPGLWLSQQLAQAAGEETAPITEVIPGEERDRRLGSRWRGGRSPGAPPAADTA